MQPTGGNTYPIAITLDASQVLAMQNTISAGFARMGTQLQGTLIQGFNSMGSAATKNLQRVRGNVQSTSNAINVMARRTQTANQALGKLAAVAHGAMLGMSVLQRQAIGVGMGLLFIGWVQVGLALKTAALTVAIGSAAGLVGAFAKLQIAAAKAGMEFESLGQRLSSFFQSAATGSKVLQIGEQIAREFRIPAAEAINLSATLEKLGLNQRLYQEAILNTAAATGQAASDVSADFHRLMIADASQAGAIMKQLAKEWNIEVKQYQSASELAIALNERFANAAKHQSETMRGSITNLQNMVLFFVQTVGRVVQAVLTPIIDLISSFVDGMRQGFQDAMDAAKVTGDLNRQLDELRAVVRSLLPYLYEIGRVVGKIIYQATMLAVQAMKLFFTTLRAGLKWLKEFKDEARSAGQIFKKNFLDVFTGLSAKNLLLVGAAVGAIKGAIVGLVAALEIITGVSRARAGQGISKFFDDLFSENTLKKVAGYITRMRSVAASLRDAIRLVLDAATGIAVGRYSFSQLFDDIFKGLQRGAGSLVSRGRGLFEGLLDQLFGVRVGPVQGVQNRFKQNIRRLISDTVDGIADALRGVGPVFRTLAGGVSDDVVTFVRQFRSSFRRFDDQIADVMVMTGDLIERNSREFTGRIKRIRFIDEMGDVLGDVFDVGRGAKPGFKFTGFFDEQTIITQIERSLTDVGVELRGAVGRFAVSLRTTFADAFLGIDVIGGEARTNIFRRMGRELADPANWGGLILSIVDSFGLAVKGISVGSDIATTLIDLLIRRPLSAIKTLGKEIFAGMFTGFKGNILLALAEVFSLSVLDLLPISDNLKTSFNGMLRGAFLGAGVGAVFGPVGALVGGGIGLAITGALELAAPGSSKKVMDWIDDTILKGFKALGSLIKDTVWPGIKAFFDWFKTDAVPAIVAVARAIADFVEPRLKRLWQWFSVDLLPALRVLGSALKDQFINVMTAIGNLLKDPILPLLGDFFKWLGELYLKFESDVLPILGDLVVALVEHVIPAIVNVIGWIATHLIAEVLTPLVRFIADHVVPILKDTLVGAFNVVVAIINGQYGIIPAFQAFWDIGESIVGFVKDTLIPMITGDGGMLDKFKDLYDWLDGTFLQFWQDLPGKITGAFSSFGSMLEGVFRSAMGLAVKVINGFIIAFNNTIGKIPGWAGGPGTINLLDENTWAGGGSNAPTNNTPPSNQTPGGIGPSIYQGGTPSPQIIGPNGIPIYDTGGVVPGRPGERVWIRAMAGERYYGASAFDRSTGGPRGSAAGLTIEQINVMLPDGTIVVDQNSIRRLSELLGDHIVGTIMQAMGQGRQLTFHRA